MVFKICRIVEFSVADTKHFDSDQDPTYFLSLFCDLMPFLFYVYLISIGSFVSRTLHNWYLAVSSWLAA